MDGVQETACFAIQWKYPFLADRCGRWAILCIHLATRDLKGYIGSWKNVIGRDDELLLASLPFTGMEFGIGVASSTLIHSHN